MWLFDKLRSWRDWLCAQLAASVAVQVQTAFLEDAADCAIALQAKIRQLDEAGLKDQAQEFRRQLTGMFTAIPPTAPSQISPPQDNGVGEAAPTASRKPRRSITQEDLFHAKRSGT